MLLCTCNYQLGLADTCLSCSGLVYSSWSMATAIVILNIHIANTLHFMAELCRLRNNRSYRSITFKWMELFNFCKVIRKPHKHADATIVCFFLWSLVSMQCNFTSRSIIDTQDKLEDVFSDFRRKLEYEGDWVGEFSHFFQYLFN